MLATGPGFGNRASPDRFRFAEVHLGMTVHVTMYAADADRARVAARAAFDAIATVEAHLSDYRPTSEIRRLEHQPIGTWHPVSTLLADALARARELAEQSNGAFDPTIGPVSRLWRAARRQNRAPDTAAVSAAMRTVGWRHYAVDPARSRVRLHGPALGFDLGGFAKGLALDSMARTLEAHGVDAYLIQAGGDLRAGGAPPGTRGWRVAAPVGPPDDPEGVWLERAALAVSGDAEQFLAWNGRRISHVIDPRTGWGVTHGRTVYVLAPSAADADGWATAIAVDGTVPQTLPAHIAVTIRGTLAPADGSRIRTRR